MSKHAIKCDLNVQIPANNGVLWALEDVGLYAQLHHSVKIAVGLKASILMISAGFKCLYLVVGTVDLKGLIF